MIGLALALVLTTAAPKAAADVAATDVEPVAQRRAVGLLPLTAAGTVTAKQAKGVTAQLRGAAEPMAKDDLFRLLASTRDDDNAVRRCGADATCFDDLARIRGADRLVEGSVSSGGAAGLVVTLRVHPGTVTATTTLMGDDGDEGRIDRVVREVFAEDTLRGTLRVEGQAADEVSVDGTRRGTLQAADEGAAFFEVEKLREGDHDVVVTRPISKNGTAYEPFSRKVAIRHRETNTVAVTLLPKTSTAELSDASGGAASNEGAGVPVLAVVTAGVGVVVVGAGATFGVLSLLDAQAVEARAASQQLVFPRDQALIDRGNSWALAANVSYGVGAVAIAGGVAWWLLAPSPAAGENP